MGSITFTATLLKYNDHGDKTGWTYIHLPASLAQELKPGNKKSIRVKGKIDEHKIEGVALLPAGNGDFILPFNAEMRKGTRKSAGAQVTITLEPHADYSVEIPTDLEEAFDYEQPEARKFFDSLTKSHRNYFIKWIISAKTDITRANRIANTISATSKRLGYNEMIRELKARK